MATFYRCGGQSHNCLCEIFSGFCVPIIIKIDSSFSTKLLTNNKNVVALLKHCTTRGFSAECRRPLGVGGEVVKLAGSRGQLVHY